MRHQVSAGSRYHAGIQVYKYHGGSRYHVSAGISRYQQEAAKLALIGYSCSVNSRGIRATWPAVLSTKNCLALCCESAAAIARGMVTIRMAFSWTW